MTYEDLLEELEVVEDRIIEDTQHIRQIKQKLKALLKDVSQSKETQ